MIQWAVPCAPPHAQHLTHLNCCNDWMVLPRSPHAAEPLDHAPANAARQESTQRESMVWRQELAILLESQKHIPLSVQRPAHVNGSSVGARLTLRQFAQRAFKMNKTMLLRRPSDAHCRQQITKPNSCPNRVANSTSAPVKPNSLLGHVLFLPTVACTNKGHRNGNNGSILSRGNLFHAQIHRLWHPGDFQLVVSPRKLRHSTMVPHHIQRRRGDPTCILQVLQGRFRVEGMRSRVPQHGWMPLDPLVRCACITGIDLSCILTRRHFQAGVPESCGQSNLALHNASITGCLICLHWFFWTANSWQ